MNVKYAVRFLREDGTWAYRSMHNSSSWVGWEQAQLWNNPKTAAKEAEAARRGKPEHLEYWKERASSDASLSYILDRMAPKPSATVVVINIGEPA